jgi:hypothetical protein
MLVGGFLCSKSNFFFSGVIKVSHLQAEVEQPAPARDLERDLTYIFLK